MNTRFLVLLISATLLLTACTEQPGAPASQKPHAAVLSVQAIVPEVVDYQETITTQGEILPWEEALIGADLPGMKVTSIHANLGDTVKKGQILASFDDAFIRADLAAALAQKEQARLASQEANNNAKRIAALKGSGALSRKDEDSARAQAASAKAGLQAANARVATLRLQLERSQLRAPDDGIISDRQLTLGQVVNPGIPLFRLIRQGKLEWHARLSAANLANIKTGMAAEIINRQGQRRQGHVRVISPSLQSRTADAYALVRLDDTDGLIAGELVHGHLLLGQKNALRLPAGAVIMRQDQAMVFVIQNDGRVQSHEVVISERSADGHVLIASGISANDRIVARGGEFLYDGNHVTITD